MDSPRAAVAISFIKDDTKYYSDFRTDAREDVSWLKRGGGGGGERRRREKNNFGHWW